MPPDWDRKKSTVAVPPPADGFAVGHRDDGPTLCIQSLAVLTEHQHKGIATVLLADYIQRIQSSHIVQRIVLICREPLIKFYSRFGFVNKGLSNCSIGGGQWFNMVSSFISTIVGPGYRAFLLYLTLSVASVLPSGFGTS